MSEKKSLNFIQRNIDKIYNIGAAIVILGALFKIEHIVIGPIDGGIMLTVGLVAEALVFTLSAFEKNEEALAFGIQTEELVNQNESTVSSASNNISVISII